MWEQPQPLFLFQSALTLYLCLSLPNPPSWAQLVPHTCLTGVTSLKSKIAPSRQSPVQKDSHVLPASQLHSQPGFLPSSPMKSPACFSPNKKDPFSPCYSQQTPKSRATWPKMIASSRGTAIPKPLGSPSLRTLL